jgi:hypothetical protein
MEPQKTVISDELMEEGSSEATKDMTDNSQQINTADLIPSERKRKQSQEFDGQSAAKQLKQSNERELVGQTNEAIVQQPLQGKACKIHW